MLNDTSHGASRLCASTCLRLNSNSVSIYMSLLDELQSTVGLRPVVALVWCQPLNRRILPNPSVPSLYWACMPVHSAASSRYPWAYNPHPGFMQTQGDGRVQSAWFNLNPCRTLLLWMFRQSHRDHAYRLKRWTMLLLAEPTKLSLSMRQGCLISSVKHKIALHYQHLIHARPLCLTWSYRKQKA
jgi:hypothetical protein